MRNRHDQSVPQGDTAAIGKKDKSENLKSRLILDAAFKLFCEKGYDTTSTDEVSQAAGVSKATLYAHFKSKENLLLEVVKDKTSGFSSNMLPSPSEEPLDIFYALRRIADKQASLLLTHCDFNLQHLIEMQAPRFPEIGRMFWEEGAAKVLAEVGALLRAATADGQLDVPDPELAAVQFLSLVRGDIPILRRLMPDMPVEERLRTQIEGALRLFLAGYSNDRPEHEKGCQASADYQRQSGQKKQSERRSHK